MKIKAFGSWERNPWLRYDEHSPWEPVYAITAICYDCCGKEHTYRQMFRHRDWDYRIAPIDWDTFYNDVYNKFVEVHRNANIS